MISTVRVTVRYGHEFAEVIRCVPIRGPSPESLISVNDRSDGAWIEVVDRDGRTVYRNVLPDPHAGQEIFADEGGISRLPQVPVEHYASLELPWPGNGARLLVHSRSGVMPGFGMEPPPSLRADIQLQPMALEPVLGAEAPPHTRKRPIWGANNPNALTLAFFAEGFTSAEIPLFHQVIDRCIAVFETTAPFNRFLGHLSIAEVDTVSMASGIQGNEPRETVFKGRFQAGSLDRVILIDQTVASKLLDTCFNTSAVALVVANTTKYGGSGGAATVFSCEPTWAAEIAIHELGHSLFGLADEYDVAGQAATMQPVEPNVCGTAVRSALKWADLVSAQTPLPTQRRDAPVPADVPIGAYEGAKYQASGVYRPEFNCKMRTSGAPFCLVCQRTIETRLTAHRPL